MQQQHQRLMRQLTMLVACCSSCRHPRFPQTQNAPVITRRGRPPPPVSSSLLASSG